ncbi:MAG TPA: LuxR C-terminal-related transcriptional regulator, partial [Candidatus Dormibacteraeota bacterium]|nr:LuxR C-terminal-related transcriptional regulator [Candidatus Dormibacteraeota bacterium]
AEELAVAIDHGERQLPGHLREILLARLAPLAEPSRDVMRAAAASGRRVDDELLAEVLDRPPDDVDEALRDGLAHGVLVSDPGTGELRFRHALVRDAVDGELLPGERRRLHQAFATALEGRRSAGGATARPEELAFHWEAAGRRDRAALAELDAARAAAAVSAWAEASRRYQRALALDGEVGPVLPTAEMPEILLEAANAASLAGDYEVAAGLARRAVPLVDPDADPARAAVVHQSLRWFLWEAGDLDAAAAEVAEALRLTPATPPSALRARAVAHAAGLAMSRGDPVEALRLAEEAIAIGRDAGARAEEALGLGIAGWAHATSGDVDESTRLFEEGMAIARSLGSAEGVALGYSNLTAVLDRAGRTDEALDLAAAGFAEVERLGLARSFGVPLLAAAARMRFHQGRWAEADELLERARSLAPMPAGQVAIELLFARLAAARGRFDRADAALDIAVRAETAASFRRTPSSTDGALDPASSSPAALHAIIEVAAWRSLAGDTSALAAARVVEDAALQRTLGAPLPDPSLAWVAALGLRVEADAAVGATYRREEHARSEALGRVAMLGQWLEAGRPALAGDLDRAASVDPRIGVMARQCLAEGDRAQGRASLSAWEEVAAGWERLGRPLPVAYARFRAAESGIGSADDRVAARAALIAAHAAAARLGAEPLRLEAERLARLARVDLVPATEAPALRASSSPPASGQARPTDETLGLTPRELEVLRLVAEGWSNPEIAAGLGISAKTASVHVSNVLDKLGVPNRVEAAVAAIRLGLARGQAGDDGDEHADDMGGLRAGGNAGSAGGAAAVASVRRTFMFTDIVGSTQLAEAIGDGAWHDLLRWHDATLRREFERHAGREVDHAGDGFLVVFRSPRDAVACAVAIQRALAAHRASAGFALAIRIGLHEGEAVERDGRFVGATVHLAARIAARAEGGTILGSATTLRSAGAHPDGSAVEVRLAGISSPVAVARVGW